MLIFVVALEERIKVMQSRTRTENLCPHLYIWINKRISILDPQGSTFRIKISTSDSPGTFEENNAVKKGVEAHRSVTAKRKMVDLLGCLHGDVFNQEKYILNDTKLRIKLNRSRDGFSLMAVHEVPQFKYLNTFPLDKVDANQVIVSISVKNNFTPYVHLEKCGGDCAVFNYIQWQELGKYKSVISKFFSNTQPPQKSNPTNN
uniref:(California timema) hypothetical protein n=1 Tax=Timema californicum TaxID=61474 RepID=A0A7R9P5M1_TIMCA|nr:unnamed protein product [Timema californicum]